MSDEPLRPDPDRLLQHTSEPHRGKLKVFFGACAGVGKTWAMLAEAQRLRAQGLDILIGVAETHGRKETAAMLEGLSTLPSAASLIVDATSTNSISMPRWRAGRR